MVLLAAAICTKAGKALVSRQFVEMTRARIEGLLASFPKLIGSGSKQHTFIETDSVRYVYQPMEKLYMLLITTKASNILEDLETLRLFSRVIPEYCKTIDEKEINEHCFELLFAFDEIVALGYRENVNLAQIRTFTDMESHEEKVYKAMRETQEKEAKQKMLERAEEIRRQKIADKQMGRSGGSGLGGGGGGSSQHSSGFGSSNYNNNNSSNHSSEPSAFDTNLSSLSNPPPSFSQSNKVSGSAGGGGASKAMKLGTNKDILPAFIEQQARTVMPSSVPSNVTTTAEKKIQANQEKVHIKIEEKISLTCGKDGGVQNLEVLGVLSVRVADEDDGKIKIALANNDTRNLMLQTNPNVDKNLFKNNSVIGLRDPSKSFPVGQDVGVLKWRFQTQEESEIPLTINCWPSETKNGCDVSIEYELQKLNLELNNVVIIIPIPSNVAAPIIKQCDGEYQYEKYKNCLLWRSTTIDNTNATGSFEFSVAGHPSDFFPINVSFVSPKSYCDIQLSDVVNAENTSESIKHSTDIVFTVDKYEIV
jgi:hypothetical protein